MAEEYEEKVYPKDEFLLLYKDMDLMGCIIAMHKVRARIDKGKEVMAKLNAEHDALRIDLIPKKMEDANLENMVVKGIGRVTLTGDMYVKQADKAKLFTWLRRLKLGDLITEGVNSSTLKAFLRKRIKDGKPIPDEDVVKITAFTRASITKVSE